MFQNGSYPTLGRDAMLLILTWAAGTVDAVSYLGLGHVFTAMMTGNTVLLGLALAQGELLAAGRSALALLGFAMGVVLGAMIVERDDAEAEWPPSVSRAFVLEAAILALFAALWFWSGSSRGAHSLHALIVVLGAAMGLQAAAVRRLDVPGIATTYITGTITHLFVDVVGWSRAADVPAGASGEPIKWEQRVGLLAGVLFVYGFGALCGGLLQVHWQVLACVAPLIAVAVVVVNAYMRYGSRRW
jgi:uncharacterized membrane protein YoaK (UPF0700 family)